MTNPCAQRDAQAALHARYGAAFALTAMDLSAEAEAFGCAVMMSESEVATVVGRRVTSAVEAQHLGIPRPGDKRTAVSLEAACLLSELPGSPLDFAGCIGPFSLAARLACVSEALELTASDPAVIHTLLEKSTAFWADYVRAFLAAGARGVIMVKPATGLLSPRGLAMFSSAYIRRIAATVEGGGFTLLPHNCAAKLVHLPAIQETGLKSFHFGALMDLPAALGQVAPDVVLCGNLDPASVFVQLPPVEVRAFAAQLFAATAAHRTSCFRPAVTSRPLRPWPGWMPSTRHCSSIRRWAGLSRGADDTASRPRVLGLLGLLSVCLGGYTKNLSKRRDPFRSGLQRITSAPEPESKQTRAERSGLTISARLSATSTSTRRKGCGRTPFAGPANGVSTLASWMSPQRAQSPTHPEPSTRNPQPTMAPQNRERRFIPLRPDDDAIKRPPAPRGQHASQIQPFTVKVRQPLSSRLYSL